MNIYIIKIKYVSIFLILFLLVGCNSSNKSIDDEQTTKKGIIETSEVVALTNEQENFIAMTIAEDSKFYTETCEKKEKKKTKSADEIAFIEVSGKSPSHNLLRILNKEFNTQKKFLAAKDGVAIFRSGLLIGYKDRKKHREGYLISVSISREESNKTVSVDLSKSKTSLSGIDKTYLLKKDNSGWKITNCTENSYN